MNNDKSWINDYFDRMENYQFLVVNYRVWLRERANPKNIMQFTTTETWVESIEEGALRAMQTSSDDEWECFKVDFLSIYAN